LNIRKRRAESVLSPSAIGPAMRRPYAKRSEMMIQPSLRTMRADPRDAMRAD